MSSRECESRLHSYLGSLSIIRLTDMFTIFLWLPHGLSAASWSTSLMLQMENCGREKYVYLVAALKLRKAEQITLLSGSKMSSGDKQLTTQKFWGRLNIWFFFFWRWSRDTFGMGDQRRFPHKESMGSEEMPTQGIHGTPSLLISSPGKKAPQESLCVSFFHFSSAT